MSPDITVEARIGAPVETVWRAWTEPAHIVKWNAASSDWHCPSAEVDLRPGGRFRSRMEARDGSQGFDFEGEFTEVEPERRIVYRLGDDREVVVEFTREGNLTHVRETFAPEATHPLELQRAGWQSILDNFRRHAESLV